MLNVGRFTHLALLVSLTVLLSACKDAAISFSSLGGSKKSSSDTVITTSFSMSSPSASSISNDFTPLVTGTYPTNGHSIYFYKDGACGTSMGSAALVSSNTFTANALAFNGAGADDGLRTIYYKVHDGTSFIGSCLSTGLTYTLDTVAPSAPSAVSLSSPASSPGSSLNPTLLIGGIDTANTSSLSIFTNPVCSSSVMGSATGPFAVSATVNVSSPLTEGTPYTFYVKAVDAAGNTACSAASVGYTPDLTPPSATSINIAGGASYTNVSNVSLTFTATGASDMYITNTSGCGSGGTWEAFNTVKPIWALGQTNSTATVYVKFRDLAGNESGCISDTINHDNLPPSIAVTSAPAYINLANVNAYGTVSGTCSENGRMVDVKFNGGIVSSIACSSNAFSASGISANALGEGAVAITAEISDLASNLTVSSSYNVTKDTVAPAVAISVPTGGSYVNMANQNTFSISGSCSGGVGSVAIKIDGSFVTSFACSTGFSGTVNMSAYSEFNHGITAEYTDIAGNTTVTATTNVIKDTVAPGLIGTWTSSPGSPHDNTTPSFSNSLSEAGNVRLYASADTSCFTPISNLASTGGGSFTANITTPLAGEGYKNFNYLATDTAGNVSNCNSVSFGSGYYLLTVPVLTGLTQRIINGDFTGTHNHLIAGDVYSVNVNNSVTGNDTYMNYTCSFDRVVDGTVVGGSDCSFLPSGGFSPASYSPSTGVLSWTVGYDAFGPYEIKFTGTRTGGTPYSHTVYSVLDVVTPISTTNLVGYYDAMFSSTTGGSRNNIEGTAANFTDLKSVNLTNYMTATIASWGTYGWQGSLPLSQIAERSNPHNLSLGGSTDKVNFGMSYNSYADVTFDFWFHRNGSVPLLNKPLLSNAQGTVGLSVFENPINDRTIEVKIGSLLSYPEQLTALTSTNLKFLAQLNEPSTKPIKVKTYSAGVADAAFTGTPTGAVTYGIPGPITNGTNTAVSFAGSSYIDFGTQALGQGSQYTVCAWFKTSASGVAQTIVSSSNSGITGDTTSSFYLGISSANKLEFKSKNCTTALSSTSVNDGLWHFACGTQATSTLTSYLDGGVAGSNACTGYTGAGSNPLKIGANTNAGTPQNYFNGSIDEVFVMSTALAAGSITNIFASRIVPHCISKSHIYDSIWQYVGVLVNDTSNWLQLSFGEQNECNVGIQTSDHFSGSTNSLMLANDPATGTNGWTGRFGEIRMYSDANSSTPGTNYGATSKKYAMPPEVVGGLRAWYRNESLHSYSNNSSIDLWVDSSGNGYDLQQATAINKPLKIDAGVNSKPIARFNGTSSFLMDSTHNIVNNGSSSATVFIVGKRSNNGASFLGTSNPYPLSYYIDGAGNNKTYWGFSLAYADSGAAPSGSFYITTINYDGAQGTDALKLRTFENAKLLTSSYASAVPATLTTAPGYTVGSDHNGAGNFLNGEIAEIIVFSTSLPAAKQQQVEEYLSRKFGIQLVQ